MAKVELESAQNQVREFPEGEVIFSRQLTLQELLHIKPGEETRDLLNDVPFNFEVRDLGDSLLHIATFPEIQLGDNRYGHFSSLLRAAKPGGVFRGVTQDVEGTLDDWRIILPEVREKDSRARELYEYHSKIPEFLEFEANHFDMFWKALESVNRRREAINVFNRQSLQFIDEREFFAKYRKGVNFPRKKDIKYLSAAWNEYLKPFLEEKGFNIPPNSDPAHPFLETRKLFESMSEQERRALSIEFYEYEVNRRGIEAKRAFGAYFRGSDVGTFRTTLIGERGELHRIGDKGGLKSLDVYLRERYTDYDFTSNLDYDYGIDSCRRFDDDKIELKGRDLYIRMSIVEGEGGYKKVKLEDQYLPKLEMIAPLIIWQTDKQTGRRSYLRGRFDNFPNHDTLLGQLVVSAYSPEVRDQMPKEIKMRGIDGKKQKRKMLEGQVPLLIQMQDPRHDIDYPKLFLMQSPVTLGLEALAKT